MKSFTLNPVGQVIRCVTGVRSVVSGSLATESVSTLKVKVTVPGPSPKIKLTVHDTHY